MPLHHTVHIIVNQTICLLCTLHNPCFLLKCQTAPHVTHKPFGLICLVSRLGPRLTVPTGHQRHLARSSSVIHKPFGLICLVSRLGPRLTVPTGHQRHLARSSSVIHKPFGLISSRTLVIYMCLRHMYDRQRELPLRASTHEALSV